MYHAAPNHIYNYGIQAETKGPANPNIEELHVLGRVDACILLNVLNQGDELSSIANGKDVSDQSKGVDEEESEALRQKVNNGQ